MNLNELWLLLLLPPAILNWGLLSADDAQLEGRASRLEERRSQYDERRLSLNRAIVSSYQISSGANSESILDLHEESIHRWSNPVTGAIYGDVFLWTNGGRPDVIASLYQYDSPKRYVAVEFHSLSTGTLVAKKDSMEVWSPVTPGVKFQRLDDAPVPASTDVLRLVQMRTLAREFRVRFTTPDSEQEWLRLLPQPSYRYRCEPEAVVDGAVFIFAQGTNPEAVLVLEVQETKEGERWHFAFARQTGYQLDSTRAGQAVWTAAMALDGRTNDRKQPYTVFFEYPEGESD